MKQIFEILGNKIKFLILISMPLGLICGLIEIAFALNLNEVLITYNLIQGERNYENYNPITILILIGFLRFIFFFLSLIISNLVFELLNQKFRELVIKSNYNYSNSIGLIKTQLLLNNVTNKIAEFLNSTSQIIINTSILFILYIFLINQSIHLTLMSSLFFLILFTPIFLLKKKISTNSEQFRNKVNLVLSKIFKDIKNINFLKIVGSLNNEKNHILDLNSKTIKPYLKYNFNLGLINQLPNFLGIILFVSIVFFNSKYTLIDSAVIVSFLYLMVRSIVIFGHIIFNIGKIIFNKPYIEMMFDNFGTINDYNTINASSYKKSSISIKKFDLNLKNVEIGYDKSLIKNINLDLNQGEFCLITGKSGIGKSALLATIIGLIKKKNGTIKWGGVELEKINLNEFRKNISYCSTEPYLIEGTIKENILYGISREISNDNINDCLENFNCDFLKKNGKYDLEFQIKNDGSGLSSGQKQRISIVRALLNMPKVILLDEATVNIDEAIEENIVLNIKKMFTDTSILAISHRNSLIKYADKFLELK
jgi:ABC-type multidrug transport system fused ATPase/permease subunit